MTRTNTIEDFHRKFTPEPNSGCWLWVGSYHSTGYGSITVGGTQWLAHRLSAHIHGLGPEGKTVCHKCDVKECVNPAHLVAADQKFNMVDAYDKGICPVGEARIQSKLRDVEAVEIFVSKESNQHLSQKYGVSVPTISRIRNGKIWKRAINRITTTSISMSGGMRRSDD